MKTVTRKAVTPKRDLDDCSPTAVLKPLLDFQQVLNSEICNCLGPISGFGRTNSYTRSLLDA